MLRMMIPGITSLSQIHSTMPVVSFQFCYLSSDDAWNGFLQYFYALETWIAKANLFTGENRKKMERNIVLWKHLCHHSDVYPFRAIGFPSFSSSPNTSFKFFIADWEVSTDKNWHWWQWIVQIMDEIMHQICRNFLFRNGKRKNCEARATPSLCWLFSCQKFTSRNFVLDGKLNMGALFLTPHAFAKWIDRNWLKLGEKCLDEKIQRREQNSREK